MGSLVVASSSVQMPSVFSFVSVSRAFERPGNKCLEIISLYVSTDSSFLSRLSITSQVNHTL
jgi:hypothetical protein